MYMSLIVNELLTIKEASEWATGYIGKHVTTSNIGYLIQYGRVKKIGDNGTTQNQFRRPVLNRTEKDKTAYSETIFHLKRR